MSKEISQETLGVSYVYNPLRDVAPVDQFGFIDLRSAYVNNSVPGNLTTQPMDYNDVDDPASLLGRSSDVFDALRKAEYVKGAESAQAAEAASASSTASE